MQASEAARATPVDGVAAVASDVRTPVWVCCYGRPVSNVRYRRVCVLRAWFGQWCHVYVCRAYTWLRVCCCWSEARTRCAVWLFAVGSLRDFPESLAEGIYIPLCASGPQLRQFGGVCLIYEHSHHAFIHTLLHNVPDKRNEYSALQQRPAAASANASARPVRRLDAARRASRSSRVAHRSTRVGKRAAHGLWQQQR